MRTTLCLNMIVKNEIANLERCLTAVAPYIQSWVIVDTGSTDGTPDYIKQFFKRARIKGELHSAPFHNFSQARNAALDRALASTLTFDYLLLHDADMELIVEDSDFAAHLDAPIYYLMQQSEGFDFRYWNPRVLDRHAAGRYHGVTHEYLAVPGDTRATLTGAWYRDHLSGSNRSDKYARDIRLLREGLDQEPDNARYWFYLGQSYRDAGRIAEAAEAFAKRATMGGFEEEAWWALVNEARCRLALEDEIGFRHQAMRAYARRSHRAEPLYDLAKHYRLAGLFEASRLCCETALRIPLPATELHFVEAQVYRFLLRDEYSIAAFYSKDAAARARGFIACDSLALDRTIPHSVRARARSNLKFYAPTIATLCPSFEARHIDVKAPDGYQPMNPSVTCQGERLVVSVRTVNYRMTDAQHYVMPTPGMPIHTRNLLLTLDDTLATTSVTEVLPPVDLPPPRYAAVRGFEDTRLFEWRGDLWTISCVRELTAEGWCEQILARIGPRQEGAVTLEAWRALQPEGPRLHQKNWMPQVDGDALRFVYGSDPTQIIDATGATVAEQAPSIAADAFRGGSQAIRFQNGWLCLIHEAVTNQGHRTYRHRFIWLDGSNRLKKTSQPFTFEGKSIEFAAGLAWHPDGTRLVVSYGTDDCNARIATVVGNELIALLRDTD